MAFFDITGGFGGIKFDATTKNIVILRDLPGNIMTDGWLFIMKYHVCSTSWDVILPWFFGGLGSHGIHHHLSPPFPGDSKWPFYPLFGGHDSPCKGSRFHSPSQKRSQSIARLGWYMFFTFSKHRSAANPRIEYSKGAKFEQPGPENGAGFEAGSLMFHRSWSLWSIYWIIICWWFRNPAPIDR